MALSAIAQGEPSTKQNCSAPPLYALVSFVLTHLSNSFSPEQVFSVLNSTFGDNQSSSYADYIELSLQLQYNRGQAINAFKTEFAVQFQLPWESHGCGQLECYWSATARNGISAGTCNVVLADDIRKRTCLSATGGLLL